MRIIVEGWRFLPHSFAIANQFKLLEFLKNPHLEIYHQDIPYLEEKWQPTSGLFDDASEALLQGIASPPPQLEADATIRISVPYNFAPSTTQRTCLFGTTEWGTLHNESLRITGAPSLREGHANSDIIIVTPSHWSKDGFLRSGACPDRIAVIPCGIDPQIYKPLAPQARQKLREKLGWEGFVFLNIGAGTPNKGVDLLLKAFAVVIDSYPDARLVLKGEESIYWSDSLIAQTIDELTFEEAEKVLPRLAYNGETLSFIEMAQLYQAADAYVTPYLAEGFNLPALEAAACGLPVICTQGGSTDDFTHPDFALRINSTFQEGTSKGQPIYRVMPDLDHLITLMKTVIEKADFCEQARQKGPEFITSKLTWHHISDRWLDLLATGEIKVEAEDNINQIDKLAQQAGFSLPSALPHLPKNETEEGSGIKLNLGCGSKRLEGYINVDKFGEPDLKYDLETFPWPWSDNSVGEIQLIHVLEHLGRDPNVYLEIMKELYRVCRSGAKIYIAVPHYRHDNFFHDPTHVRAVTPIGLQLFCQRLNQEWIAANLPYSTLGLHLGVNFEVIETQYLPSQLWFQLHPEPEVDSDLFFTESALYNNLIEEIKMVLEVVKE